MLFGGVASNAGGAGGAEGGGRSSSNGVGASHAGGKHRRGSSGGTGGILHQNKDSGGSTINKANAPSPSSAGPRERGGGGALLDLTSWGDEPGGEAGAGTGSGVGKGSTNTSPAPSSLGGVLPKGDLDLLGSPALQATATGTQATPSQGSSVNLLGDLIGNEKFSLGSSESAVGGVGGGDPSSTPDTDLRNLILEGRGGVNEGGGVEGLSAVISAPTVAGFVHDGKAMQPLRIDTQGFGQRWMVCSGESQEPEVMCGPLVKSPSQVASRLGERMGMHTVEVIPHTLEGIFAGDLKGVAEAGGGEREVCLVHCKVWPERGVIGVTVRAPTSSLAAAAAAFARNALSQ
ncbi:unnamed protein product [Choristocarpus tenellus]